MSIILVSHLKDDLTYSSTSGPHGGLFYSITHWLVCLYWFKRRKTDFIVWRILLYWWIDPVNGTRSVLEYWAFPKELLSKLMYYTHNQTPFSAESFLVRIIYEIVEKWFYSSYYIWNNFVITKKGKVTVYNCLSVLLPFSSSCCDDWPILLRGKQRPPDTGSMLSLIWIYYY